MAFDVWVLCLIGSAFAMFFVSLLQDLIAYLRRVRHSLLDGSRADRSNREAMA